MPLGAITGLAFGSVLRRPVTAVLAVVAVLALLPGLAGPAARHLTMYGAWSVLASQPVPLRREEVMGRVSLRKQPSPIL